MGSLIASPIGTKHINVLSTIQFSNYEEFLELTNKNPEYRDAWVWTFTTMELMGIYLKEGVLDIEMLAKFNPWWYIRFWGQYKDIVYEQRKRIGPSYYNNMEYLMDSILKYLEEHPELLSP